MRNLLIGLCIAGAAFAAGTGFGAGRAKSIVTNLLQQPLNPELASGVEVLVDLVEIPPNAALDRHWHPGEEFHYYLDGDPRIEVQGRGELQPAPGTAAHVPLATLHRAGAGARGARILVFRVHASGKPWRYLEGEEAQAEDVERR